MCKDEVDDGAVNYENVQSSDEVWPSLLLLADLTYQHINVLYISFYLHTQPFKQTRALASVTVWITILKLWYSPTLKTKVTFIKITSCISCKKLLVLFFEVTSIFNGFSTFMCFVSESLSLVLSLCVRKSWFNQNYTSFCFRNYPLLFPPFRKAVLLLYTHSQHIKEETSNTQKLNKKYNFIHLFCNNFDLNVAHFH